jgi:hypothetical protein
VRKVLGRSTTSTHVIEEADHTFSSAQWRDEVADVTAAWLADDVSMAGSKRSARSSRRTQ